MARKCKMKRISALPMAKCFVPQDISPTMDILLSLEEYEAIRLIDVEGMSQEQCAEAMGTARTTVQALYNKGRKKIGLFLVGAGRLKIEGGDYSIAHQPESLYVKEEQIMKIAVTYKEGEIFQHFGHSEAFKIYQVSDGKVTESQIADTNGSGHGALAEFLKELEVDTLICGGIGGGAMNALGKAGIKIYPGVSGNADAAVDAFVNGTLSYNPEARCSHHEHGHHEHGHHECGSHGENKCC